ncbi:MAG: hypothetical protein NUV53_01005 [Patescibacteria group bacterium]|nr:hypothetical protein [Patescibacteria group bacterium]
MHNPRRIIWVVIAFVIAVVAWMWWQNAAINKGSENGETWQPPSLQSNGEPFRGPVGDPFIVGPTEPPPGTSR